MKKLLVFVVFSAIFLPIGHSQTFDWARSTGTSLLANATGIAADEHGDIYLCGNFVGLVHLGNQTLQASGAREFFLAKYDSRGEVIWAKKAESGANDFINAMTLDKDGNCCAVGTFMHTMVIGRDTLQSHGQNDMFIAKYNKNGDVLWARSAGGKNEDHATVIATDKAGNFYVGGYFKDTMYFPNNVMIYGRTSTFGIFFAKYDGKGNFLWAKAIAGANYYTPGEGLAIATAPNGETYITGFFQTEAIFGTEKVTNHGTYGLFLARYNSDGKLIWVKSSSKDGSLVLPRIIALDKAGNAYISGTYTSTALFDTITTESKNLGNPDFFLAKYNPSGRIIWLRSSTSFGTKTPYSINCDKDGNPIVTGLFHDTATFGPVRLSASGKENFFVVKYDAKGNSLWAKQAGLHGTNSGRAITLDKSGNIFIAGNFTDTADFGKVSLLAPENTQDIFLTKISPRLIVKEERTPGIIEATDFQFVSCEYNAKSKSALVQFYLGKDAFVSLRVLSETGEIEESYIEGQRSAGFYHELVDMKSIPAGEYYCRLQAGSDKATKKIEIKK